MRHFRPVPPVSKKSISYFKSRVSFVSIGARKMSRNAENCDENITKKLEKSNKM